MQLQHGYQSWQSFSGRKPIRKETSKREWKQGWVCAGSERISNNGKTACYEIANILLILTWRATKRAWVLDLSPTVADPCLTASAAYSTWWIRPWGDHVVLSPSYWLRNIFGVLVAVVACEFSKGNPPERLRGKSHQSYYIFPNLISINLTDC